MSLPTIDDIAELIEEVRLCTDCAKAAWMDVTDAKAAVERASAEFHRRTARLTATRLHQEAAQQLLCNAIEAMTRSTLADEVSDDGAQSQSRPAS